MNGYDANSTQRGSECPDLFEVSALNTNQIQTNEDYQAALKEIEQLMIAAEPHSPSGERFMALVTRVEIYEKEKGFLVEPHNLKNRRD